MPNSSLSPSVFVLPAQSQQLELNIVTNPTAATSATDQWTVSGMTVTRNATGSPLDPLVPTGFNLSSTASSQTFTTVSLTVPATLMNKKLKVEFYYQYVSGTSFTLDVLDGTDTHYNLTTDVSGTTTLPQTSGKFVAYFDANSTTSLKVRFSSTGTGVTKFTQLIVGPGIQPQGGVIQGPISYTPSTDGFGTVSGMIAFYSRRGSYLKVQGRFTTGTVNANTAFISLPTGLNVDSTSISANIIVGKWWRNQANANLRKTGALSTDYVVNANIVRFNNDDYVTAVAPSVSLAGNALAVSTEVIWFEFELPIAEWSTSGTVQLAQNDVEYAWNSDPGTAAGTTYSNSVYYGYGPSGTLIPSINSTTTTGESKTVYRVQFQTPVQPGDQVVVELNDGNGWFNAAQRFPPITNNASSYGVLLLAVNSTTYGVAFGNAGYNTSGAASFNAAGSSWSGVSTWRWRVRKSSAGASVGFGIVSSTSAGLLPISNSNLDDPTATRLGLKQYLHGTTYNGGVAPTVTTDKSGTSVDRGVFIPYQTQANTWRLRFNINVTWTSATVTAAVVTINGVTSISVTQQISGSYKNATTILPRSIFNASASTIALDSSSASGVTGAYLCGDVELDSKPTWAY